MNDRRYLGFDLVAAARGSGPLPRIVDSYRGVDFVLQDNQGDAGLMISITKQCDTTSWMMFGRLAMAASRARSIPCRFTSLVVQDPVFAVAALRLRRTCNRHPFRISYSCRWNDRLFHACTPDFTTIIHHAAVASPSPTRVSSMCFQNYHCSGSRRRATTPTRRYFVLVSSLCVLVRMVMVWIRACFRCF